MVLRKFACPAQLVRNVEHLSHAGDGNCRIGHQDRGADRRSRIGKGCCRLYSITSSDLLKLEGFADKKRKI